MESDGQRRASMQACCARKLRTPLAGHYPTLSLRWRRTGKQVHGDRYSLRLDINRMQLHLHQAALADDARSRGFASCGLREFPQLSLASAKGEGAKRGRWVA